MEAGEKLIIGTLLSGGNIIFEQIRDQLGDGVDRPVGHGGMTADAGGA